MNPVRLDETHTIKKKDHFEFKLVKGKETLAVGTYEECFERFKIKGGIR